MGEIYRKCHSGKRGCFPPRYYKIIRQQLLLLHAYPPPSLSLSVFLFFFFLSANPLSIIIYDCGQWWIIPESLYFFVLKSACGENIFLINEWTSGFNFTPAWQDFILGITYNILSKKNRVNNSLPLYGVNIFHSLRSEIHSILTPVEWKFTTQRVESRAVHSIFTPKEVITDVTPRDK